MTSCLSATALLLVAGTAYAQAPEHANAPSRFTAGAGLVVGRAAVSASGDDRPQSPLLLRGYASVLVTAVHVEPSAIPKLSVGVGCLACDLNRCARMTARTSDASRYEIHVGVVLSLPRLMHRYADVG
jgi:hypothetical protein